MSENERVEKDESRVENSAPVEESRVEATYTAVSSEAKGGKKNWTGYIVAIVIVVAILSGVLYKLEKEGRSSTQIFSSMIEKQRASEEVANVNGKKITNADLDVSIQQMTQVATAQQVDVTNPDVQAEIKKQSLEVLINTELLKQAAAEKGIVITDEAVNERLESVKSDIGGEEELAKKMEELGISQSKLEKDIRDELLIKELLDQKFAESDTSVTEEDVNKVYENAGGVEAGLPALEEVRSQIEEQVKNSKEQEIINSYLAELKADAEITQ